MSEHDAVTQDATGTFEVTVTPQEPLPAPDGGLPLGRFALKKAFSGQVVGKAAGTMMSVGTPKAGAAAAYVALDQFSGTVDGRRGGFVLVHRGIMSKSGARDLDVRIATDSGSGELTGITGVLEIDMSDGKHQYTLKYSLPPSD
jgi:hypothetical protein